MQDVWAGQLFEPSPASSNPAWTVPIYHIAKDGRNLFCQQAKRTFVLQKQQFLWRHVELLPGIRHLNRELRRHMVVTHQTEQVTMSGGLISKGQAPFGRHYLTHEKSETEWSTISLI